MQDSQQAFTCDRCPYHRRKGNAHHGVTVAGNYGKCIREGGACKEAMQMDVVQDRTQEIRNELTLLNHTLKMSVQKAIRIGELLTEQKEFVGHGNFIAWIEGNLDISFDTASRYIKLHEHDDKIRNLPNLQKAYQQIETIEAQEKQSREERDRGMIAEYRKTGAKPPGWDRSLDYIIKKDADAEVRQRERLEQEKQDREQRAREYRERQEATTHYKLDGDISTEALRVAADTFIAKSQERQNWKEKIRLSDGGKEDAFMDAIIDYMETLPDDNRRIEACNNIIKICRNISVELQKVKEANNG
jgi:hypothetical protein